MKTKSLFIFFIFFFGISTVYSQSDRSELSIETRFWGNKFYKNGIETSESELMSELKNNTNAYYDVQRGLSLHHSSKVIEVTVFLGAGIWFALDPEANGLISLGIGAGLGIVTGMIKNAANNKIDRGLDLWNDKNTSNNLSFDIRANGPGIYYNF